MRRWGLITRVNRMPSKLVYNWSAQTNFPPTHLQPTPTGRAQIFARFRTFTNFFKNVPDYRNRSNFARGPNLTHSSIWEKNIWGSEKKAHSLISGPPLYNLRPLKRWQDLVTKMIRKICIIYDHCHGKSWVSTKFRKNIYEFANNASN